jgi:hypothetical protein
MVELAVDDKVEPAAKALFTGARQNSAQAIITGQQ